MLVFSLRWRNRSIANGLMKMFASWSLDLQYWNSIDPSSTKSLMKWWWISIRLLLQWNIGFFVIAMVLVLSQWILINWEISIPRSSNNLAIQMAWVHAKEAAIYFVSTVDRATICCFLLLHETNDSPKKKPYLDVFFHSSRLLAQSEFVYASNSSESETLYYRPKNLVLLM